MITRSHLFFLPHSPVLHQKLWTYNKYLFCGVSLFMLFRETGKTTHTMRNEMPSPEVRHTKRLHTVGNLIKENKLLFVERNETLFHFKAYTFLADTAKMIFSGCPMTKNECIYYFMRSQKLLNKLQTSRFRHQNITEATMSILSRTMPIDWNVWVWMSQPTRRQESQLPWVILSCFS